MAPTDNIADGSTQLDAAGEITLRDSDLAAVKALFEHGQTRQALDLGRSFGPLRNWRTTRARILASRILADMGAPRLAQAFQIRAYRADRADAQARAFFVAVVLERQGPLAAWQLLREFGEPAIGSSAEEKDAGEYLFSLRARVASTWRDFETARHWLERAGQFSPDSPWLSVEKSFLLEQEDRYEECLASAQHSLQLKPWYRPGVFATAHALQMLDRDDEALALLTDSTRHIESTVVQIRLAALQCDLGRYVEAEETFETISRLPPIIERQGRDWMASQRFLIAYRQGDFEKARRLVKEVRQPSLQKLAVKLTETRESRRQVHLPVAFVRQHRVTCSPATLSALSKFWNKSAEHLAIAEEICYDGTPAHSERHWAEQNGFVAREFTVTWESAVAVLERGIPFALHTTEVNGGHAQAVMGFDELRQTLLLRDPFHYFTADAEMESLHQRYRATGPRGMAMVPADRANLLEGLALPDTALYDQLHQLHRALSKHQRDDAYRLLDQMKGTAPMHRLTLTARRALAAYDSNTPALLDAIDALDKLYPDDGHLNFAKLRCLAALGRREERLALLDSICRRTDCDPMFWQEYAVELGADARNAMEARRWLRRALRRRPVDLGNLALIAEEWWREQRFETALELHRFTACVAELQEAPALNYFNAARWCHRTDEALQFLRQRVRRWGDKSHLPMATLFRAYVQLDELPQAFAMLDAELQRRPDDGELLLFAAEVRAHFGQIDAAGQCLARAGERVQRDQFLRVEARLAELQGEPARALACLNEVVSRDPLALDAHQTIARLHAMASGRAAALNHLEAVCSRFPHHFGLYQVWVTWTYDEGARVTERIVRRLVELHPDNGWARRELALALAAQGRLPEALAESRRALHLEPSHPESHCTRALLLGQGGDDAGARESFREALRLTVDAASAIHGLWNSCQTSRERSDALEFVAQELQRQPVFGPALLIFRELARLDWPNERLLEFLREQLRQRPMQWQARVTLVHQLAELDQLEEALRLAREATDRFPLVQEPWFALAFVQRIRFDREGEREALDQLARLQPHDSSVISHLAAFHSRNGDFPEARAILERACMRNRLDAQHSGQLAGLLWRTDERDAAIQKAFESLNLNADDDWMWEVVCAWTVEIGRPQLATSRAHDWVARRKGEARPWRRLATALANENRAVEALDAINEALSRNPRSAAAHDTKAVLLCQLNRHDDALDVCRATIWNGRPPVELQFRAAWIQAHRGHLPRAIAELRQLLEAHPGHYVAWRELADWYWRRADEACARACVSQMLRLSPLDSLPYCFRAEIRKKQRDHDGAKADFHRALQLDPSSAHAATGLFEMQLADDESDEAEGTLKIIQTQIGGKVAKECTARLVGLRAKYNRDQLMIERARSTSPGGQEFVQASRRFQELCLDKKADPAQLEAAFWKLENMADASESQRILKEALENPQANPDVGALWVRSKVARKQWGLSNRLEELLRACPAVGRRAIMAYAKALGSSNRKKGLRFLLKDHGHWLKDDPLGWASIGLALAAAGQKRQFLRWMATWRNYESAGQDVFAPYVHALRAKGRDREADKAARAALLQTRQGDEAFYQLTLWCAAEDALAGRTQEAREALHHVVPETISAPFRRIHRLIRSVIEIQGAPMADLKAARKAAVRRVRHVFSDLQFFHAGRATRRIFRRSVRRMSRDGRSLGPMLWGYWRLYAAGVYAVVAFPLLVGLLAMVPWLLPLVAGAFYTAKRRRGQISD